MNSLSFNERNAFDDAFTRAATAKDWNSEFIRNDLNWERKFDGILKSLDQNASWEDQFKEFDYQNDALDWNDKFNDIFSAQNSKSGWESELNETPNILDPDPVSAPSSEYIFEAENPFMTETDPLSQGLKLLNQDGHLSQAALAFEAAVQRDPSNSLAWFHLGTTQAENEKEGPAIAALERSVKEEHNAPAFIVMFFLYISLTHIYYNV